MKKTIPLLVMLAAAMPALAVEAVRPPAEGIRQEIRKEVMEKVQEKREEVKNIRQETKEKISANKEENKKVREETKVKISAVREDLKKNREVAKKELKAKLAAVKDAKKREAVERINENISKLNDERTGQFGEVLAKLSTVLDRVEERANRAGSKGIDVTNAKTAVVAARQAITEANTAVKTQSDKVYALAVTDEATLKQKVGEVRQQIRDDLSKLHETVKSAREAVRKSATTLAKTPRVEDAPEVVATSTVNQ